MNTMLIQSDTLTDIADAIRDKLVSQDTYLPSEMADAIENIEGGEGSIFVQTATRRFDGTYLTSSDGGWIKFDTEDAYCLNYSWQVKSGHKYRIFTGDASVLNRGRNGFHVRNVLADAEPNAQLTNYTEFAYNQDKNKSFGTEVTAPFDGYLICYLWYAGAGGSDLGYDYYLIDVTNHNMSGIYNS